MYFSYFSPTNYIVISYDFKREFSEVDTYDFVSFFLTRDIPSFKMSSKGDDIVTSWWQIASPFFKKDKRFNKKSPLTTQRTRAPRSSSSNPAYLLTFHLASKIIFCFFVSKIYIASLHASCHKSTICILNKFVYSFLIVYIFC